MDHLLSRERKMYKNTVVLIYLVLRVVLSEIY